MKMTELDWAGILLIAWMIYSFLYMIAHPEALGTTNLGGFEYYP
jgi:hypothetical protein